MKHCLIFLATACFLTTSYAAEQQRNNRKREAAGFEERGDNKKQRTASGSKLLHQESTMSTEERNTNLERWCQESRERALATMRARSQTSSQSTQLYSQ